MKYEELKHWQDFINSWGIKWKICIQPTWKIYFVHNYEPIEDEFETPIDRFWYDFASFVSPFWFNNF